MRKAFFLVFSLAAFVLFTAGALTNGTPAPQLTPECADEGIETIADCPDTGCGDFGDALLNRAKNAVPTISSAAATTLEDIRKLVQPSRWNTGSPRTSIVGPGKEGTAVEVKAFMLRVKREKGESCNCGLTPEEETDIHFALVDEPEDDEETSVTAEVTPRVRHAGHPNWVFSKLRDLEGDYVKIVGTLMLDTKHIRQGSKLDGERPNKGLKRFTNWEIHPITSIFRCTKSKRACDRGNGWEEVN
jgi:hypothetical protein